METEGAAEPVAGMTTTQLCIDRGHKSRLSAGVGLARVLAKEMRVTIVVSLGLPRELVCGFLGSLMQVLLSASFPCLSKNSSLNDVQDPGQSV